MNNTSKAKSLITGDKEPLNEAPEGTPPGGSGGPPRRPMRPGGPPRREAPGGPDGGDPSGFSPQERLALKDLVILDLLAALGGDSFYESVAKVGLGTAPLTPDIVRHFLDEAGKYADKMPPQVNALMGKISSMPNA